MYGLVFFLSFFLSHSFLSLSFSLSVFLSSFLSFSLSFFLSLFLYFYFFLSFSFFLTFSLSQKPVVSPKPKMDKEFWPIEGGVRRTKSSSEDMNNNNVSVGGVVAEPSAIKSGSIAITEQTKNNSPTTARPRGNANSPVRPDTLPPPPPLASSSSLKSPKGHQPGNKKASEAPKPRPTPIERQNSDEKTLPSAAASSALASTPGQSRGQLQPPSPPVYSEISPKSSRENLNS